MEWDGSGGGRVALIAGGAAADNADEFTVLDETTLDDSKVLITASAPSARSFRLPGEEGGGRRGMLLVLGSPGSSEDVLYKPTPKSPLLLAGGARDGVTVVSIGDVDPASMEIRVGTGVNQTVTRVDLAPDSAAVRDVTFLQAWGARGEMDAGVFERAAEAWSRDEQVTPYDLRPLAGGVLPDGTRWAVVETASQVGNHLVAYAEPGGDPAAGGVTVVQTITRAAAGFAAWVGGVAPGSVRHLVVVGSPETRTIQYTAGGGAALSHRTADGVAVVPLAPDGSPRSYTVVGLDATGRSVFTAGVIVAGQ